MIKVLRNGEFLTVLEHPEFLPVVASEFGISVSELSLDADDLANFEAKALRQKIRREILPTAGDTQSIQSTIADNVGHLMEELGRFMAAVNAANSLEDIKAAALPLAVNLAPLVTAIDTNQCALTHHVKGTAQVITDACDRADAIATVLVANAGP